jgi:hypothetical protein
MDEDIEQDEYVPSDSASSIDDEPAQPAQPVRLIPLNLAQAPAQDAGQLQPVSTVSVRTAMQIDATVPTENAAEPIDPRSTTVTFDDKVTYIPATETAAADLLTNAPVTAADGFDHEFPMRALSAEESAAAKAATNCYIREPTDRLREKPYTRTNVVDEIAVQPRPDYPSAIHHFSLFHSRPVAIDTASPAC